LSLSLLVLLSRELYKLIDCKQNTPYSVCVVLCCAVLCWGCVGVVLGLCWGCVVLCCVVLCCVVLCCVVLG
jgi:hypothetical protein